MTPGGEEMDAVGGGGGVLRLRWEEVGDVCWVDECERVECWSVGDDGTMFVLGGGGVYGRVWMYCAWMDDGK